MNSFAYKKHLKCSRYVFHVLVASLNGVNESWVAILRRTEWKIASSDYASALLVA